MQRRRDLDTDEYESVISACLLELGRIVELEVDTDDKTDPSCEQGRLIPPLTMLTIDRWRGHLSHTLCG